MSIQRQGKRPVDWRLRWGSNSDVRRRGSQGLNKLFEQKTRPVFLCLYAKTAHSQIAGQLFIYWGATFRPCSPNETRLYPALETSPAAHSTTNVRLISFVLSFLFNRAWNNEPLGPMTFMTIFGYSKKTEKTSNRFLKIVTRKQDWGKNKNYQWRKKRKLFGEYCKTSSHSNFWLFMLNLAFLYACSRLALWSEKTDLNRRGGWARKSNSHSPKAVWNPSNCNNSIIQWVCTKNV